MSSPTPQDFEKARAICEKEWENWTDCLRFTDKLQKSIAQSLADEREKFVETCIREHFEKIASLESEKSLLEKRVRELEKRSRESALIGQASLDEANNLVKVLEAEMDDLKRALLIASNEPDERSQEASHYNWLEDENSRLKAENERLKAQNKMVLDSMHSHFKTDLIEKLEAQIHDLKAELADKKGNLIQEREGWNKTVLSLETRLAEAVRVNDVALTELRRIANGGYAGASYLCQKALDKISSLTSEDGK